MKSLNEASLEASVHKRGEVMLTSKFPNWWTIASGVFVVISLFHYLWDPLKFVALGAIVVAGGPIALKAVGALRRLVIDINMLMSLAGN